MFWGSMFKAKTVTKNIEKYIKIEICLSCFWECVSNFSVALRFINIFWVLAFFGRAGFAQIFASM